MGTIHLLSTEISNKIAAGEVVERPVSVIKELVENSIDAGAHCICVEIKNGGNIYIRVTDDGSGMSAEDAKIAFLRHATSKIEKESDLDAIYTLGFRGEALSSIGAVAEVDIFTKRTDDEEGIHVTCKGGEIMSSIAAGTPNGTTFVVKNLFYNTPARMKFLKKDATEAGYISDMMSRFILAHPEISFKFINNGKEQLFSSGDNQLINAVYTVYGRDYAKACLNVDYKNEYIHMQGVVGNSSVSRPNRTYQSFFVNRRYVKSPLVIRAIEEAYKNQIMIGKFPMSVLNIDINPAMIDINVHPTKLEVKFSDEKVIYETIYFGVKNALYKTVNIPEVKSIGKTDTVDEKYTPPVAQEKVDVKPIQPIVETKMPQLPAYKPTPLRDESYFEKLKKEAVQMPAQTKITEVREENMPMLEVEEKTGFVRYTVIGQAFSTYIIVQRGDELLLVDQHAAHERLKYEQLKVQMVTNTITSQILLIPTVVNVSAVERNVFIEHTGFFGGLGFDIEEFDETSLIVRSVPSDVENTDIAQVVLELLMQIGDMKKNIQTEDQDRLMYTIACKAAVKANHDMTMQEMEGLVKAVFELENINTCPHGRPIIVSMTKKDIEKEFKRIV